MKLYKHKDYKEYVAAQIEKNIRKLENVWVRDEELILLAGKIKRYIPKPEFGLCHGVRNGWEVKRLKELLGIKILGTDISPTASQFPDTIEWDFHKVKKEWVNNVDFIYTNSFDHSYDPQMCLDLWMECIKKGVGVCFIHWGSSNKTSIDAADCVSGTLNDYRKLFNEKYRIVEEFGKASRLFFAIKHKTNKSRKKAVLLG